MCNKSGSIRVGQMPRRTQVYRGGEVISGNMYWLKKSKLSLPERIQLLIEWHKPKNIKYVLVSRHSLDKEIVVDNIKIKPNKIVIENHFWFIQVNNIENGTNIPNMKK